MVQDFHILFQVCKRRHQAVTAPVGAGGRDDVVRRRCAQDTTAAAAFTFPRIGKRYILADMRRNRPHANLVAEITDGDIRHTLRAQQVPERLALGLQLRHIHTHGIVVYALRVGTAGLH